MQQITLNIDNPQIETYLFNLSSLQKKPVSKIIIDLLRQNSNNRIEDLGMLSALNEVSEEDNEEVDSDELAAIFNGEYIALI